MIASDWANKLLPKIEQHIDPPDVSLLFVIVMFYLSFQGRRKKNFMGFEFSISVWGPRFLFLYFCHHLCNCNLVSNETCKLEFWNLKISGLFIIISKSTDDLSVARNEIASSLSYIFLNEHHFNPKVKHRLFENCAASVSLSTYFKRNSKPL